MRPFAKFFGSVRVAEAASPPAIAALAIYPEYPAVIERDTAYRVTVQQSRGDAYEIPVYGHCGKSALAYRTRGGDVNRRFCEFAFDGGPVRVDSAVSQDVGCYSVFPTSPRLRQSPVPLRPDRTEVRRRAGQNGRRDARASRRPQSAGRTAGGDPQRVAAQPFVASKARCLGDRFRRRLAHLPSAPMRRPKSFVSKTFPSSATRDMRGMSPLPPLPHRLHPEHLTQAGINGRQFP